MSALKFYEDAYLTQLTTIVNRVSEDWVEFNETIFYPEGGGQPGDTGTVSSGERTFTVLDTRKADGPGTARHQLETTGHGLAPGDEVTLELDWDRRYRHMRMHTAMHLLGSLIPVPVTGGAVGAEKSRLDFDVGEHQLDKEDLTRRMNALIEADHPVVFETITEAMLDDNPGLVRTMSVQPPRGTGTIRMVRIEGVDYQPCGGTHLNSVGEIGRVRVSKIENKGKRNRRVHLVFDEG